MLICVFIIDLFTRCATTDMQPVSATFITRSAADMGSTRDTPKEIKKHV